MTVDSDIAGQAPHYTWKLDDVIVSSYKTSGSAAGSDYELKDFSSATMSWLPPLADGGRGAPISGHWDRATGRFTGDPAVLAAFEDLGAERWADGTLAITAAVPEPGSWALMALGVAAVGLRLQRQRPTA